MCISTKSMQLYCEKVWISEESSSGPLEISFNCTVDADPIASFEWRTDYRTIPKQAMGRRIPNMPNYTITETDNISVLTLIYDNSSQISNDKKVS